MLTSHPYPSPWVLLHPCLPLAGEQIMLRSRPLKSFLPTDGWMSYSWWGGRTSLASISIGCFHHAGFILRPVSCFLLLASIHSWPLFPVTNWKVLFFFVILEPCQRESLILVCVVSRFYEFIFILLNIWMLLKITLTTGGISSNIKVQTLHGSFFLSSFQSQNNKDQNK